MLRALLLCLEVMVFSLLLLAARCANYGDVFVFGRIYFTDADCYARMTRARVCDDHPGTILRHHDFENYPAGIEPHTTAPLDYLIVALSAAFAPWSAQSLELAGALISPLLALLTGWFLWGWARAMRLPYRRCLLTLFALSPILVHGTELGRPDHQSVLMLLLTVALCAEWSLQWDASDRWSCVAGAAWSLALWVSVYEPLLLLLVVICAQVATRPFPVWWQKRKRGWLVFAAIGCAALLLERRGMPAVSVFRDPLFARWARTIGELAQTRLTDPIWLRWCGGLLLATPLLLGLDRRGEKQVPWFAGAALLALFALTAWQVRWGYFFAGLFVLTIPAQLGVIRWRVAALVLFVVSLLPVLRDWDERLWPNESRLAARIEQRREMVDWRTAANMLSRENSGALLAPWWLSPSAAYWSGRPAVAGSSHESLPGIAASAAFWLATDAEAAHRILREHGVEWVLVYDGERTVENSAAILGIQSSATALARILDRTPAQAPPFLALVFQNGSCKIFRVR